MFPFNPRARAAFFWVDSHNCLGQGYLFTLPVDLATAVEAARCILVNFSGHRFRLGEVIDAVTVTDQRQQWRR